MDRFTLRKYAYTLLCCTLLSPMCYADTSMSHKKSCACGRMSKAAMIANSAKHSAQTNMVYIPAGEFIMGGRDEATKPDELPLHPVKISAFYMDATEVTNTDFANFVKKTKYITTAEKPVDWERLKQQLPPDTPKPSDDLLQPGGLVFTPPNHPVNLDDTSQWWQWVNGANWHHPLGPQSKPFGPDHPVVQVSWDDANAYCQAMGKRLPTEAEREWAARGGLKDQIYPWGNEAIESGKPKANTWQGHFPDYNSVKDGYLWTSPVTAFPPNSYGLYDMSGNVWEWTADLYDVDYYSKLKLQGVAVNPSNQQTYNDPDDPHVLKRVMRGGSFLCHKSYCSGYRVSSRMKSTPDTSLVNVGFRCVKSA